MFYLLFKNHLGEIKFSGDGSEPFSLTHIAGLGLVEKIYETREYIDFDGQQTISSRFAPRTITITFDLTGDNISSLTARLYRILSCEGVLYVISSNSRRRVNVNQIGVDSFSKNGKYRSFSAQFICDNSYFWDTSSVNVPCYQLKNNICFDEATSTWNLDTPTIWGESSNDTTFINSGDIKAYPIITVYSKGNAEDDGGFELLRVAPDNPDKILQRFALNYALSDGEQITLCFDPYSKERRRYITSSKGVNLLNFRTEDSSLTDFYLDCGENRIIVNNLSRGNLLSAKLSYENQYVEGVF